MLVTSELIQIAIGVGPLLLAIAVLWWSPARKMWIRTRGGLAATLLFVPFWMWRSAIDTCTGLGQLCPAGEVWVRVNPPWWGAGHWDCEVCLAAGTGAFALQLNEWRPALVLMSLVATVVVAGAALWRCSRAVPPGSRCG